MTNQSTVYALVAATLLAASAAGQDLETQLRNAAANLATTDYRLAYKFKETETIRYKVEHLTTVDTRISGNKQTSKSRTVSTKVWKVKSTRGENIKFVHSIEDVDMWQKTTGRDEVRYNSRTDNRVPQEYERVVESLNKPLATVTINKSGKLIAKESNFPELDLGFGGLVVPLPKGKVRIGHTWSVSKTVKLRENDGRIKEINTRMRYRLEKVKTDIATISVKTQILTPVNAAKLKSQLIQKISSGKIKFDIEAGRVISKQLDWDENVIGFNGPASNIKYLARFTETIIDTNTARRQSAFGDRQS